MKKTRFGRSLIFLICLAISTSIEANYQLSTTYDTCGYEPSFCDYVYCNKKPGYTIYVDGEFLYWKAEEDGLGFATGGFTTTKGNIQEVDWKWEPGFRVGGGFLFGCNNWNLSLTYTWLKAHAKGFYFDATGNSISTFFGTVVGTATGDWNLHFKTLDLSLSKDYFFCNVFTLAPLVALQGAYIKDTFVTTAAEPPGVSAVGGDSFNSQRFCAVGPKMGINGSWYICNNFSFIAEAAFAVLWGEYNIRRIDSTVPSGNELNIEHNFATLRFVPQYLIGIQWDCGICANLYHLKFLAAWEHQQWINHNQIIYGPAASQTLILNRNTNLNLYGLTLRTEFLF